VLNRKNPNFSTFQERPHQYTPEGQPVRVSKKTGAIIHWPDQVEGRPVEHIDGPLDTPAETALKRTYDYHESRESVRLARLMMDKYNYVGK